MFAMIATLYVALPPSILSNALALRDPSIRSAAPNARGPCALDDNRTCVDMARHHLENARAHTGDARALREAVAAGSGNVHSRGATLAGVVPAATAVAAPSASAGESAKPASAPPRFIVYTRASKEAPYLSFFVEWYVGLGFDRIVVLMQTGMPKGSYLKVANHPSVQLIWADKRMFPDALLPTYQEHVLGLNPEAWVLLVDIDEFLALDEPSIGAFVDARASHHSCDLSALGFRWVSVEHMDPTCESLTLAAAAAAAARGGDGLGGTAASSQTFSGPSYYDKYMAKAKAVRFLAHPRVPTLFERRGGDHCVDLDGVRLRGVQTLRHDRPKHDPAKPYLVPLTNGSLPYAHAALLHLETCSLSNMLVKALTTLMPTRAVRSKDALASLLGGGTRSGAPTGGALLRALASALGTKLLIPLFRVSQAAILERDMATGAATVTAGAVAAGVAAGGAGLAAPLVGARDVERAPGSAALALPNANLAKHLERLLLISGGKLRHFRVCNLDREAGSLQAILDRHGVSMHDATSTLRALTLEIGRLMHSTHAVITAEMFKRGGAIASCLRPWNKQLDWAHALAEGEIECLWRVLMPGDAP
jgi:hypothetical protein